MSEREELISSIANTIKTYRAGEIPQPNVQHVEKWASQFTPENQLTFLREFDHVMKQSFITESEMGQFLGGLITNEKLVGANPREYWLKANVLDIQVDGQSQTAMRSLFDKQLQAILGITLQQCGSENGDFIYLDDVIFSGGRAGTDLDKWVREFAPPAAKVNVIVIAWHTLGQYQLSTKLKNVVKESGKSVNISYWRLAEVENRRAYKNSSEVLWPAEVPDVQVVTDYLALPHRFPFEPREPNGKVMEPFSSEQGRQILEREFLIAGAKIRSQGNVAEVNRPLGHSFFGVGFGATIATYRNCPNNCPLAMWWGGVNETGALKWYPLLPRKNYSSPENVFAKLFK